MAALRSIFALELCMPLYPGSPLRAQLRDTIASAPAGSSYQQKWAMYRRLTDILWPQLGTAVRGCWDFFDDDDRARSDFEMWTRGMTTREGARRGPVPDYTPYRGQGLFATCTMAFQLMQGSPTERSMARHCEIPQGALWRRDTFAHVLGAVPSINFASVIADVSYVLPGTEDSWGLTLEDLAQDKFEYLRTIE